MVRRTEGLSGAELDELRTLLVTSRLFDDTPCDLDHALETLHPGEPAGVGFSRGTPRALLPRTA